MTRYSIFALASGHLVRAPTTVLLVLFLTASTKSTTQVPAIFFLPLVIKNTDIYPFLNYIVYFFFDKPQFICIKLKKNHNLELFSEFCFTINQGYLQSRLFLLFSCIKFWVPTRKEADTAQGKRTPIWIY